MPFFLDFSISQWLSEKSVPEGEVLPEHLSDELLESLSLRPYLKSDSRCSGIKSSSSGTGWNNGNNFRFFLCQSAFYII